jgi:hypothetical protein
MPPPPPPPRNPRFRAKIVPHVLRQKSFVGRPPPHGPKRFEVCEKDVAAMMPKMAGLPMCYNHDRKDVVGKILASYRNPKDNAWEIEYELNTSTVRGKDTVDWVNKALMRGVSLQHLWGVNEPLEVSLCWKGMRPGSETYEAVAASKISQLVHFDSNLGYYSRDSDPEAPIAVAAAFLSEEEQEDLIIFEFAAQSMADNSAYVAASMDNGPDPSAAAVAPAAAAAQAQAQAQPPPQPQPQPQDPITPEELFKRFTEMKKRLGEMNAAAPLRNSDKQEIMDNMALLEVEKEKESLRASNAEAELKAYKEKEAAARKELEDKLRKEQDEINANLKQKIGDFMATFDDRPEALAEAKVAMDGMTTAGLAAWDKQNEKVKASYSGGGFHPSQRAQNAMAAFYKQKQQQQMQQMQMQMQMQQQQQRSSGLDSTLTIPVAASAGRPADTMPVAASSMYAEPFEFGKPHDRPYATEAIAASKQAAARGNGNFMYGKYRPAQEFDAIEASNNLLTWDPGVGGHVNLSRVTNNPEIQRAMMAVWEATPPGNGCDGDSERLKIPSLFQDRSHLKIAERSARAAKAAMPRGDYDPYRSHMSGLEP